MQHIFHKFTATTTGIFLQVQLQELQGALASRSCVMGYPGETKLPIGQNFMATPYVDFGGQIDAPGEIDQEIQMAVTYPTVDSVDPPGLSGSGFWTFTLPTKRIWAPSVSLVGLITNYDQKLAALIGYNFEKLIEFVKGLGTKFTAGVDVQHS